MCALSESMSDYVSKYMFISTAPFADKNHSASQRRQDEDNTVL